MQPPSLFLAPRRSSFPQDRIARQTVAVNAQARDQASFAISRSLNFWTLPVDVFGTSVKTTRRGAL